MHCKICKRVINIDDYDMVTQCELLDASKENNASHPECSSGKKPPVSFVDDYDEY